MDEQLKVISETAAKIMNLSRTSASFKMKFLSNAIAYLKIQESQLPLAVDGAFIYYNPLFVIDKYKENASYLDYAFLHMTIHCLFQHIFAKKKFEHTIWNMACDIYAFHLIESAKNPKLFHGDSVKLNRELVALTKVRGNLKVMSPEHIANWLLSNIGFYDICFSQGLFAVDNHDLWYEHGVAKVGNNHADNDQKSQRESSNTDHDEDEDEDSNEDENDNTSESEDEREDTAEDSDDESQNEEKSDKECPHEDLANENDEVENTDNSQNQADTEYDDSDESEQTDTKDNGSSSPTQEDLAELWKNLAYRAQTGIETGFMQGDDAQDLLEGLHHVTKEHYSYEEFLRKFSVLIEQIAINDNEFDYSFYTYGLSLYGNIPLIEPLEYKDAKRIHDFVIAIDTSGSTYGPLVQQFLVKTFNILAEQNSFDSRVCIHIIQCDTDIRDDVKIENLTDLDQYLSSFKLHGGGGTDFTPVFDYVDKLVAAKEFTDLKGLIYFTDGYGTFPAAVPQYETAFAFVGDDHCPLNCVPDWAITLELDESDLEEDY